MAGTREPDTIAITSPAGITDFGQLLEARPAPPAERDLADRRMGGAVRRLAADTVRAAGTGHLAGSLAMADVATALWSRQLRFDATDPRWPDRDRFVLSDERGAALLYALLHLTGHAGMELGALRRFGQLDSPAAGTPAHGEHPAIEVTAGPPGQGLATAVGLALAERMMAARFGRSLVDHRTWVLAGAADLVEGVGHEATCLAGQLRLERLTVLWADDETETGDATCKRLAAAGWATRRIDGHDPAAIAGALALALRSRKPTLIACRTLSVEPEAAAEPFTVPPALIEPWARAGIRGTTARRAWLKRLANHPLRAEFDRVTAGRLPETWHEASAALKAGLADSRPTRSTVQASRRLHQVLVAAIPELAGGATHPHHALAADLAAVGAESYAGRAIPGGHGGHAMAACATGLALHGGVLPCAAASLLATDAMRPALRLAAQMRQRVIHVLHGDGIGIGQDGPAAQPVEQLAALRAMPGLVVLRPADAVETVECWELAIRRADGPSLLVLSAQPLPTLRTDAAENRSSRGGYVLAEADGPRQATLIASGSEVAIAMQARRLLADDGVPVAVVSLPCWELFASQAESARTPVLGTAPRIGIEAACGFGWERWLGPDGVFIGMTGYGASAPADTLYRHFGITPEAIAAAVRKRLPQPTEGNP